MTHLSETYQSRLILIVGGLEGRGYLQLSTGGLCWHYTSIYIHTHICAKRKSSVVVRCHWDGINPSFTIIE